MKASCCPQEVVLLALVSLLANAPENSLALTNEWTKPTSGYWEEPYWSLGVLPSIEQDAIVFANDGYKALAIGPSTTANYPNLLSIKNLTVERPSNLLLLNYAGMNVPVSIASDFVLGADAFLLSYYSSLSASNFYCSGRATFAELSVATFNKLQVGAISGASAELIISNAVISSRTFYVGGRGANGPSGTVNQYGGTIQVTGSSAMELTNHSVYNLRGGALLARRINVYGGLVPSNFTMSGGRMELSDSLWTATLAGFQLQGGELQAPEIGVVTGPFTHAGGRNTVGYLGIGYAPRAEYRLEGGTLISSNVNLGTFNGFGTLNQSGGVHSNSSRITLQGVERTGHHSPVGEYVMSSGFLASPKLNVAGGKFIQSGGTNLADDIVLDFFGAFALSGGSLESSNLLLAATNGSVRSFKPCVFLHSKGVNTVKNQLIINDDPSSYYYSQRTRGGLYQLGAGTLNSHFVDVRDQFTQSGGLHSNDQIVMVHGLYRLSGGALSSPFLYVDGMGQFAHTGGTNAVQSLRVDVRATFNLNGGALSALNTTVSGGDRSMATTNRASFTQSNGTHVVQHVVTVDGIFQLNGGTLSTPNLTIKPDGDLWLAGGVFNNRDGFTMYDGVCYAQGQYPNLGKLFVRLGFLSRTTNANVTTLDLQNGSTVLRFKDSRDASSEWNGHLMIRNWSGSTNGGGADQILVGTTAQGLTPAQVQRISFLNPEGLPSGTYPARILATGEIVPGARQSLGFSRTSRGRVLSWSGNYELWTTTNLLSSWSLIPGATSPYTNSFTDPQRYFKLRLPAP